MIRVYGKPVEVIGTGLFDLEVCEIFDKGKYKGGQVIARIDGDEQRYRFPFGSVSYSCGNNMEQCKPCPQFERCFPKKKK